MTRKQYVANEIYKMVTFFVKLSVLSQFLAKTYNFTVCTQIA